LPDLVGKTLGQFRIASRLGEGGMGVVYRAVDQRLRRSVALKVISENAMTDDGRRRRFFREARSAAAVTHPNVATVYEIDEAEGFVYIAMELVEGLTLREVLRQGRPSLAETLRVMRAVARALAKAHEKGIVHRDLKPENVMLNEDREVKVLDFGLAKLLDREEGTHTLVDDAPGVSAGASTLQVDETASHETANRLVGTPAYMSPEQATGRPVDARTDVWAFGVMLYELLAGVRPFQGRTAMETLVAIARDAPPPVTRFVPVPPALERMVETCLRKEAGERYASGKELAAAMEAIETSRESLADIGNLPTEDVAALPSVDSATKESQASARQVRRVGAPTALLMVGAVVAAAAVGTFALRARAPAARSVAPAPAAAEKSPVAALMEDGERKSREGRRDLACSDFRQASDAAPSDVQAAVAAMLCSTVQPRTGRNFFHRAWAERARLSAPAAALVDAYEPIFQRDPEDRREMHERLVRAVRQFPDDAALHFELARSFGWFGKEEEEMGELDRSLALDPIQPRARYLQVEHLAYYGDFDRARAAIQECLRVAPSSVECLKELALIDGEHGLCAAVESDARRALTMDAQPASFYQPLANAMLAQGSSPTAVAEILANKRRDSSPGDRPRLEEEDAASIALVTGDFAGALRAARALDAAIADSPYASEHGESTLRLVLLETEIGDLNAAAADAERYLDHRDAWEPEAHFEDWAMGKEPTPLFLAVSARAGAIKRDAYERERAKTIQRWEARVEVGVRSFIWIDAYAKPSETPEDAAIALDALPKYAPLPPYTPLSLAGFDVGRTYFLAGKVDDAIPWLEKATHNCFPLDHPIEHTRAHYFLGMAREAKHDKDGACAAYAVVRDRWGSAKPRSVTAEKTLARIKALGCK
jgi:serine/threonine-protein kinase